jgi:hypothetical protein
MAKKSAKVSKESGKSMFDLIDAIYTNQSPDFFDALTDSEKKLYKNSRYMIHRFISMNPLYAPVVNAIQQYTTIPEKAHYLFLTNILPKGKQYNKYIKGEKDEKYESWLVDIVAKHYQVSKAEAITYLEIYYKDNKQALSELCAMYAIDKKELKKAKL